MRGIPVIDLFAGPGGLCEGFASLTKGESRSFEIRVSIEKDPVAHKTLSLRALFRCFREGEIPAAYYQYIRGEISREQLENDPIVIPFVEKAYSEARCAELGKNDHTEIDSWIQGGIAGAEEWVLIGGHLAKLIQSLGDRGCAALISRNLNQTSGIFYIENICESSRNFLPPSL